jgi:hypothetical protein
MWIYHTLDYAVKEGTRYAVARGQNNTPLNHSTYQGVCRAIIDAGTGLIADDLSLTFQSATPTQTKFFSRGTDCLADTDMWPPTTDGSGNILLDDVPGQAISISGSYPFSSLIAMFWPGAGQGTQFAATNFLAASRDVMQF